MKTPERAYRMLLHLYPPAFRAEYESEMVILFRDLHRNEPTGPGFWVLMALDVAGSAVSVWIDELRVRQGAHTQSREARMKTIAVLSMLIGAVEAINAMQEARIGAGYPLVGGSMGMLAGLLLLASGIMLLRGSARARVTANVAAVACLVVFAFTGFVMPLLSLFATILGIGFPIVLLIVMRVGSGRDRAAPGMA